MTQLVATWRRRADADGSGRCSAGSEPHVGERRLTRRCGENSNVDAETKGRERGGMSEPAEMADTKRSDDSVDRELK
eukprot:746087-Hanusia_phi.AAC.4